ncbi:MAG: SGNH/GDSL hydrolase family protein [Planctomycetes bacterium]|jgi:lysophospholipase L1-like esterase|nr:SGNH/GDSL hydrolase family protein [Planctomycetota bacterium]
MQPELRLESSDTIVFAGDSITAADRHRQAYGPLGFGYVHFAGNLMLARHPELELRMVNAGISGDTIADLKHRWQRDCLDHRPNVLSVLIGINDVWQRAMEPDLASNAADPEEYGLTYEQLLAWAREQCRCRLVLMEPFLFSRDQQDRVRQTLTPYVEAVRRLAEKYEAVLVPLQQAIDRRIVEIPPLRWSQDSVHPCLWAHAWIAEQWLDATGL